MAAWFVAGLVPGSPALNLCRSYRLRGEVDLDAVQAAWWAVARRHAILRTVLLNPHGEPVPTLLPYTNPVSFLDGDEQVRELTGTPFDLSTEPPARLGLVRLGSQDYQLVLVLHRAAADERSLSIVFDELSVGYTAAVMGHPTDAALPTLAFQYVDHARALLVTGADERYWEQVRWWADRLSPSPPPLALPTDRPRPPGPSTDAGCAGFHWPDLGRAVLDAAAAGGTTTRVVLLAAFQALLSRRCGAQRVAVAVPGSARLTPQSEVLVGPFTNPVVHVGEFGGRPTWRALVDALAESERAAEDNPDALFADVVRAVGGPRDPRRTPLFDAVLDVRGPEVAPRFPGMRATPLAVHSGSTADDLVLTVTGVDESVSGFLTYRAELFDPGTARLLLTQLQSLLAAAVAAPDTPVHELAPEIPAAPAVAAVAVAEEAHEPDDGDEWEEAGPETPTQEAMAEMWTEVLGTEGFEPGFDFFAVGGHSLLLPELVCRIRDQFGVEPPLWELLAASTLEGMSALVDTAIGPDIDIQYGLNESP